jgi:hypothetical protein
MMFNYKHNRIRSLEWELKDALTRQAYEKELKELREAEIKELRTFVNNAVIEWLVTSVIYTDRDEEGRREEADRIEVSFDNKADAVHYARNQRINDMDDKNVHVLLNRVMTQKMPLTSDGEPIRKRDWLGIPVPYYP